MGYTSAVVFQRLTSSGRALLILGLSLSLLLAQPVWGGGVTIEGVRVSNSSEKTRVVFDLSGPAEHRLFSLTDPERLVIDFSDTQLPNSLQGPDFGDSVVAGLRHAPREKDDLRVVLDLRQSAEARSFMLPPGQSAGHRLVVDLPQQKKAAGDQPVISADNAKTHLRDVVVAIDAGHGGRDPGAIGAHGTHEKDIVLAVAHKLEALVQREPGMRPLLTRSDDEYLTLRERIEKARAGKADVFISLHADAAYNRSARGSSVYVLSDNGASSEAARWLAQRENAADFVGGVSLKDKDDVLASVLMDLSQSATGEASLDLAEDLLGGLRDVGDVHSERVHKAGFVVLKSPDIPSVLVETAFISNPEEERRLQRPAEQQAIAEALVTGLHRYFAAHAPPGTVIAEFDAHRHVIRSGETLSAIADQYRVALEELRNLNSLDSNVIHAGQVLRIPSSGS